MATSIYSINHEEHLTQGSASIRLVGTLVDELLMQVIQDYRNRILQEIVDAR